jgi:hypothetical protein
MRIVTCMTFVVGVAACDHTPELAANHLLAAGYTHVLCTADAAGAAFCRANMGDGSADTKRFRCVTSTQGGCSYASTACEEYKTP